MEYYIVQCNNYYVFLWLNTPPFTLFPLSSGVFILGKYRSAWYIHPIAKCSHRCKYAAQGVSCALHVFMPALSMLLWLGSPWKQGDSPMQLLPAQVKHAKRLWRINLLLTQLHILSLTLSLSSITRNSVITDRDQVHFKSLSNYRIISTHSLKSRYTAKTSIWICCKDFGFWSKEAKKKKKQAKILTENINRHCYCQN